MVRIGPLEIRLAERQKPPRPQTGEVGHIATALFRHFVDQEYLPDLRWPQNLKVYDKMRRSDGQVQAVLYALELPIRRTRWYIEPASSSPRDRQIAEFVEENLFGGLEHPWEEVLRLALTMLPFGHAVLEKVYEVDSQGYLRWAKFAERPQTTISNWISDERGELEAIEQMGPHGTITIPAQKLLVFTHRREGGDPRGISVLRAAYKHWFIKDFVYKILSIGIEQEFVGVPWASVKTHLDDDVRDKLEEFLEGLTRGEKAWGYFPEGVEINRYQSQRDQANILPYIQHHDLMIARSVLAQFLNLAGSDVGSYALSEDQSDLFLMTLDAVADYVASVINRYAIRELVAANWDVDAYPRLRHDPVGGRDPTKLVSAIAQLADKVIHPDGPLEDFVREYLGLPERAPEANQPTGPAAPPPPTNPEGEDGDTEDGQDESARLAEPLRWRRQLTKWEERIKLAELEQAFETAEERLVAQGAEELLGLLRQIWPQIEQILRSGNLEQLLTLQVDAGPLAEWLAEFYHQLIEQAAAQAAEELEAPVPAPTSEDRRNVDAIAALLARSAADRVLDRIRVEAMRLVSAGVDPDEAAEQLRQAAREQAERTLQGQAMAQVNESVNRGRDLAAKVAGAKLAQYSAILDERVCPLCRRLDGKIIRTDDPDFRRFRPPLHRGCRCIWAYILPEEQPQPEVTWETPPEDLIEEHGSLLT